MSVNNINIGNQNLTFIYQQEARAHTFNQIFCDIISYGIYRGGELVRIADTIVGISPLVCIIKSDNNDKVALRIETNSSYNLPVNNPDKPYIILRYGWVESSQNFMNILAVSSEEISPYDLKVGKVIFSGEIIAGNSTENNSIESFDLTKRDIAVLKNLESQSFYFYVSPDEPYSQRVSVNSGKIKTSKGYKTIPGQFLTLDSTNENEYRIDLIAINTDLQLTVIKGNPSTIVEQVKAPSYQNYTVLAEVLCKPNSYITGNDITRVLNDTIQGSIQAEDQPLRLSDFPDINVNQKNIESMFDFLLNRNYVVRPDNQVNAKTVLRKHINFSLENEENAVNATVIPVVDTDNYFTTNTIENVLKEIAGTGRTVESLTSLKNDINNLQSNLSVTNDDINAVLSSLNLFKNTKGQNNGIAPLNDEGLIPPEHIPLSMGRDIVYNTLNFDSNVQYISVSASELQNTIDSLNKCLNQDVVIRITTSGWIPALTIKNFYGTGSLTILDMEGSSTSNIIDVRGLTLLENCSIKLDVRNITSGSQNLESSFRIKRCSYVNLSYSATTSQSGTNGYLITDSSSVYFKLSNFITNKSTGIYAQGSCLVAFHMFPAMNNVAQPYLADEGSIITLPGDILMRGSTDLNKNRFYYYESPNSPNTPFRCSKPGDILVLYIHADSPYYVGGNDQLYQGLLSSDINTIAARGVRFQGMVSFQRASTDIYGAATSSHIRLLFLIRCL